MRAADSFREVFGYRHYALLVALATDYQGWPVVAFQHVARVDGGYFREP